MILFLIALQYYTFNDEKVELMTKKISFSNKRKIYRFKSCHMPLNFHVSYMCFYRTLTKLEFNSDII